MTGFTATPEQAVVIAHGDEPLRVAAGAGTGKTTTIVHRLARAVEAGTDPARALGVTFTNKAADELRSRLREAIGARSDGRELEVATYHSFASGILDEFGGRIGYQRGAMLMDEGHRSELAARVLRSLPDTSLDLTALSHRRDELLTVADSLNENLLTADELMAAAPSEPDERWAKRLELARAAEAFARRKRELGLIEYSDLIRLAVQIITGDREVADEIAGRYDVVLLDEYQDTDPAQRLLLTTLFAHGTPVTAVGDTDQTIYEWRGASIENFESFPTDFPLANGDPSPTVPLSINRRSDRRILELANLVRDHLPSIEGAKPLTPSAAAADGDILTAWFTDDREEAAWIADEMLARHSDGIAYADMAVLCRTREAIRPIAAALRAAGIPFSVGSMGELLRVPEIADLLAWMRLVADPGNEEALLRILVGGRYRLGLGDVAAIRRTTTRSVQGGLVAALGRVPDDPPPDLRPGAIPVVESFLATYRELFVQSQARSVGAMLDAIIEALDYWAEVAALPEARATTVRLNLSRFIDLTDQWRPLDGHATLSAYLRYLDALDEVGRSEALDTVSVPMDDAVVLLTAHGAKGLEWSDVYLPSLAETVFPSSVRMYHDPDRSALVLPFELRLDRDAMSSVEAASDPDERKALLRERHMHQEWRLAYVAVTRAKHRLTLSGHAWDGEIKKPRAPSPLIDLARRVEGARRGPEVSGAEPRPASRAYHPEPDAPDPFFADGWAGALRQTMDDDSWIDVEHPDLAGEARRRADQLTMRLHDLREPESAQVDERFTTSVTSLVALAECPLRFKWIHHDRLPRKPRPSATRGTEFHRQVELHNLGVVSLEDAAEASYDAVADGDEPPDDPTHARNADPWRVFLRSRFSEARPVLVETPFEITIDGRSLRGKVDAVYADAEQWEIVDYKSGSASVDDAKRVQLQSYAVAAHSGALGPTPEGGMRVTFAFFGDDPAAEVTEDVTDSWLDTASTRIGDLLVRGELGPFDASPSSRCRWCDFLHHCDAGTSFLADERRL